MKAIHLRSVCVWIFAVLLLCAGCSSKSKPAPTLKRIPVIFDTDIGDDIDDTWALGFLLRSPELDLKLVVGDNGKPLYRAKLSAKFLEAAGRSDVPVALGVEVPEMKGERMGAWVADYDLEKYRGTVHRDGVRALVDTIMKSPEPVTVIAVGPVQNIEAALALEPRIAKRARFVGMQGSVRVGYGGALPAPEYNVKFAPKACRAAFAAAWDVTITPLDTCDQLVLTGDKYQRLLDANDPLTNVIITNYAVWAAAEGPARLELARQRSTTLFDVVAVYLAFDQRFCGMEDIGLSVTDDGFTREDPSAKKLHVAMRWNDLAAMKEMLVQRLAPSR